MSKRSEQRPGTEDHGSCSYGRRSPGSFRPHRLRRDCRGSACARHATASTGIRRAAISSSSRSTISRFRVGNWPWPRGGSREADRSADRGGRQAHLLRHQFFVPVNTVGRSGARRSLEAIRPGDARVAHSRPAPCSTAKQRRCRAAPIFAQRSAEIGTISSATITRTRSGSCPIGDEFDGQHVPSFAALWPCNGRRTTASFRRLFDRPRQHSRLSRRSTSSPAVRPAGRAASRSSSASASDVLGETIFIPGYRQGYGVYVQ